MGWIPDHVRDQTLRDWVHRFNAEGPGGLIERKAPGRRRKLTPEQEAELRRLAVAGPEPEIDGVVRWRCIDLKAKLGGRFGVDLSRVTVGRRLKELGFSHIGGGLSGILCGGPVSFLGLESVSKDDSELCPRFEPLSRRRFPSAACVIEYKIQ